MNKQIKINVVAGFLGSGKTTFITKALDQLSKTEKIVVLVNEFGSIGIDGTVIKRDSINLVEMPQGCICCSLRSDLLNGIFEIYQTIQPDRLIIEPSGIASPIEILSILTDLKLAEIAVLESFTVIVDLLNFLQCISELGSYYQNSIEVAQIVVLNKADISHAVEINGVKNLVHELNPKAKIFIGSYGNAPLQEIFNSQENETIISSHKSGHMHFESCSGVDKEYFYSEDHLRNLFSSISNGHLGKVMRAKGIFRTPTKTLLIENVFGRININNILAEDSRWTVIGLGINQSLIEDHIKGCRIIKELD